MKPCFSAADVMPFVWVLCFIVQPVLLPGFGVWGGEAAAAEPRPSGPHAGVCLRPDGGSRGCRGGRGQPGTGATGKNGLLNVASSTFFHLDWSKNYLWVKCTLQEIQKGLNIYLVTSFLRWDFLDFITLEIRNIVSVKKKWSCPLTWRIVMDELWIKLIGVHGNF